MLRLSVEHTRKAVEGNKELHLDLQSKKHELNARSAELDELVAQTNCNTRNLELKQQTVRHFLSRNLFFFNQQELACNLLVSYCTVQFSPPCRSLGSRYHVATAFKKKDLCKISLTLWPFLHRLQ
jgi:hypothetical protein